MPPGFGAAAPKAKPTNLSSKPLKSLNWTKIPPNKVNETIWGKLDDADVHQKLRGDVYNEFEDLFAAKENKAADLSASKDDGSHF